MKVIGMGEQKTPVAFRVACDKFIYIEVIRAAQQDREKAAQPKTVRDSGKKKTKVSQSAKTEAAPKAPEKPESHAAPVQEALPAKKGGKVPEEIVKLIADSVSDIADEDGWASMGELGSLLLKKQPDFDPRNFGFTKLTPLIRSLPRFEVDARVVDATKTRHIYLRDKEA